MSVTPKKLITPAQLTASAATYYTVPANTKARITKLTFTNSDTTARTMTLYLVPSGGSAGVTNILTKAFPIGPGATYEAFEAEGHVLSTGDTIQALADVTSMVTVQGSGIEVV